MPPLDPNPIISSMSNYGAAGIVAAVLLFLVIRERMEDRKTMAEERKAMDARIEAFAKITTSATLAIEETSRVNREVVATLQKLQDGQDRTNQRLDQVANRLEKIEGHQGHV